MKIRSRYRFLCLLMLLCLLFSSCNKTETVSSGADDYIKWIDFQVPYQALSDALNWDVESYTDSVHVGWVELLSLYAAQNGGDFSSYKTAKLQKLYEKLRAGEAAESLTSNHKLLNYYRTAYGAVLGGMVGEYTETKTDENGTETCTQRYGLRVFSPLAAGYSYTDYDDFGASRSYGYQRDHLGHDLLGSVGTPVVAVESGYIEHLGWNRYGGWRIGIRSLDGQRYYYYAHLRKNTPYAPDLYEGRYINAGEVIGFLGMTGYSTKENVNGINIPHLHYGLQIIFDQSQIEGWNQIWIDLYDLTRLLAKNRATTVYDEKSSVRRSTVTYIYPENPD